MSHHLMMGSVELTPLAHACALGFEKIVNLLIDKGADINYKCSDRVPPIGFAVIHGHTNVIKQILKCNELDRSVHGLGEPVIIAVKTGRFDYAKILIDALGGTVR